MAKSMRRTSRKATRKGTRKGTRKTVRKQSTRRMKRGGGFFTRNSAVAPRPNRPYREGSVGYNVARRKYEENKEEVEKLVKRLDEAVVEAWEPVLEKYGIESKNSKQMVDLIKKKMNVNDFKDVMQSKVTIDKDGIKQAQDAIENYMKISAREKKSMLQKVVGKLASQSKAARDVMELLGISNESISSLFNHIDNDTLTVSKAYVLSMLIKKQEGLLKKVESGNLPQTGGGDMFGAMTILIALMPVAIAYAAPSFGGSVIIYLILAFVLLKEASQD